MGKTVGSSLKLIFSEDMVLKLFLLAFYGSVKSVIFYLTIFQVWFLLLFIYNKEFEYLLSFENMIFS